MIARRVAFLLKPCNCMSRNLIYDTKRLGLTKAAVILSGIKEAAYELGTVDRLLQNK